MPVRTAKLNVMKFWPDDLTITQAAEDLDMNPRSLTNIRKGTDRGEWLTLFKLAEYLSQKTGRKLALEDLFDIDKD
jgi:DNA-binding XRE family transcriptional regulator